MSTYVLSDIHGEYDKFMDILKQINLKDEDTLYVLGDVLDRGPHPIKTLLKLMEMPNVICIVGNHELMAVECLSFMMQEITDRSILTLNREMLDNLITWEYNGCKTTLDEFRQLDREMQKEVLEFIRDFQVYEELTVDGRDYWLVHAGLGNFAPEKELEDYDLNDLVWFRPDYGEQYFEDRIVVSGHTPTQFIDGNPRPGYIFRKNNHIAIDCGAHIPGGRLAAICLDTGEEYYSEEK